MSQDLAETTPPDPQHQRLATALKWGIGLLGAAIIAPVIFFAVKGLIGLAIAGIVGLTIVNFAPVVGMKLATWKLKLIEADAEDNPIETMQALYVDKTRELQEADQNIVDFEAEIGNFEDQVGELKRQYPTEAAAYDTLSNRLHESLVDLKEKQTDSRRDLADFNAKIKKAQAIFKVSLAAQRVTRLSKSAESQVFAQIREQVAFDSVRTQLNRSFASLNLSLARRIDAKAALPLPRQEAK